MPEIEVFRSGKREWHRNDEKACEASEDLQPSSQYDIRTIAPSKLGTLVGDLCDDCDWTNEDI
jgi:hypothetical protein